MSTRLAADAGSRGPRAGMIVAVIGSRSFPNLDLVRQWLDRNWYSGWHLVSGGAAGVDEKAAMLARILGDEPSVIRPDWKLYPAEKYGKDWALKVRNMAIVDSADYVVAFWDKRSPGTAHAVAYAVLRRKPVEVIEP